MHIKLDDLELLKREDQGGKVKEIRSVGNLSVYAKRSIVELPIPGADGNVFQDMGRNPSVVSFDGTLIGPGADQTIKELKAKFDKNESIPFSSDISLVSEITSVVIEKLVVHFEAGVNLGISYSMVLKEDLLSSGGGGAQSTESEAPSQEEDARNEVDNKVIEEADSNSEE